MHRLGIHKVTSRRKDTRGEWLELRHPDPEIDEAEPTHYSVGSFAGDFYTDFITENNILVGWAFKLGIDFGEQWGLFFERGIRLASKPGVTDTNKRVREIFEAQYVELRDEMYASMVDQAVEIERRKRDSGLDVLLSQSEGVTGEDRETIEGMFADIKATPIEVSEDGLEDYAVPSKTDQILDRLTYDRGKEVRNYYPEVDDVAKAAYVRLFFGDNGSFIETFMHEVSPIMEMVGADNSRVYLDYVRMKLDTEARDWYYGSFSNIRDCLEQVGEANYGLFFELLERTMDEGMIVQNYIMALDATLLPGKVGVERGREITDGAFAKYRETSVEEDTWLYIGDQLK